MNEQGKLPEELVRYIDAGWFIFPCLPKSKEPWTKDGFKSATNDKSIIGGWWGNKPDANWALWPAPSGLCILDCDEKNGGSPDDLNLPPTRSVYTAHGQHFYFRLPPGITITNANSNLPKGWDVRSASGYVMLPPSIHPDGDEYEWQDFDADIADLPEFIVDLLAKKEVPTKATTFEITDVLKAVNLLRADRADDYETWLEVGMALSEMKMFGAEADQQGLVIWDQWSKASDKYVSGKCAEKWIGFKPDGGLGLKSLYRWAAEDSGGTYVIPCPKSPRPSDYMAALRAMGYSFTLNDANESVYSNGLMIGDIKDAVMLTDLAEHGYKAVDVARRAWVTEASKHSFHPLKDYFNTLSWDGKDHIGQLCSFVVDEDGIFQLLLTKWLVGSVNKIIGPRPGEHHPMFVLDGKQGVGKSRFVWWLGSPLPGAYMQSPIDPADKDFNVRAISKLVWEVEELGATFRKADREALKAFISREEVTVRKAYGRSDISKPVTASFVGTLNNEAGFLNDPTGNRRFRACKIVSIDWAYSLPPQDGGVDINGLWAQAVALHKAGQKSDLTKEENELVNSVTARYEQDDALSYHVFDLCVVDPNDTESFLPTAVILKRLKENGVLMGGSDQMLFNRIGSILVKAGCRDARRRYNGVPARGFIGVGIKPLGGDIPPISDYRPETVPYTG